MMFIHFACLSSFADERSTSPEIANRIAEIQNQYDFKVIDKRCIGDKEDPFEMGAVMPGGPFKGQCVDAENNRPPFVLNSPFELNASFDLNSIFNTDSTDSTDKTDHFDKSNNFIEVANIRHAQQWWIGKINLNSVDRVYYELVAFPSPFLGIRNDHVELRFVFKKDSPILLRSQVVTQDKHEELDDLVVSHNAYGIYGVQFDPYKGVQGQFAILGRMVSTYDRANDQIINQKGTTYQIELNLSERQKNELLLRSIHRDSALIGYNKLYHTLFRNCAVAAFDLIDDVVARPVGVEPFVKSYSRWLGPLKQLYGSNWIAVIPYYKDLIYQPSIDALEARHLVSRWVPTLNEEFNNGEVSLGKTQKHQDTIRHPDHPKLHKMSQNN